MTAPVNVTINGVSYPKVSQESLIIQNVMGRTMSTCQATIYDKFAALTIPPAGKDIVVTDQNGDRLYAGLVSMPVDRTEGISRWFDIQAQSYLTLLDSSLCYGSYPPGFTYTNNLGQALVGDLAIMAHLFEQSVVTDFGTLGASEIIIDSAYCQQGSKSLSQMDFPYVYLREVVELFCSYNNFDYYVDANKRLHYYYRETITPPYGISSVAGETLDGLNTVHLRGFKRKRDATRIRNNFVVYGANVTSNVQTGYIAGDGSSKTLSTKIISQNYPLAAPPGSDAINVWLNTGTEGSPVWTAKTVGVAGIDTLSTKDCLFDVTNQTLEFNSAPPNFSNALKVEYVFVYAGGQPYTNLTSKAAYGRIFSHRLVASDANTAWSMQTNIKNLNDQFSKELEVITGSIADSDFPAGSTGRFAVGQWVPVHDHILGILDYYWVHSVTTTILGGEIKNYALELRNWSTT